MRVFASRYFTVVVQVCSPANRVRVLSECEVVRLFNGPEMEIWCAKVRARKTLKCV